MSRYEDRGKRQRKVAKKQRKARKRCLENAEYDCRLEEEPDKTVVLIISGPWKGSSYVVDDDDHE